MKKILKVNEATTATDIAVLIARIGIATLMLTHGIPKLMMLISGGPIMFPPVFGMSPEVSLVLAVFAEVVCSVLLLAGLGTRLVLIPLFFTMLVAALLIHSSDPFAVKEPALLYSLVFGTLFFTGSGRYSLDYLLQRK
ncbi:DoxX family protein [Daejeonella sp. H1SJ63]|uniref:DoxX family protein n=1 Tax=Daejeonella sp. H1SJ63 TaxID=3034145 RepID=UPI0023EB37B8|nr:DoxX family protein [Daejeonella sp. H1SJ63]